MKKDSKLRFALIGCGEHSKENLAPSLSQIPQISVVAVCDINSIFATEVAKHFYNCDVETDWDRILMRDDLSGIIVAATPQVHYQVAREGLRRGLNVFLEKPPTITRRELNNLVDEARKRKLVTGIGHNLRHSIVAREMQLFMRSNDAANKFGNPVAMEMRYFASKPQGNRWGLKSPLRSFLLSHANHAIDFMIYQMGPIEAVNAASASANHGGIALSAQFVFKGGAIGNLLATSFAPHFAVSGTIISDKKRVIHLNSFNEVIAYGIENDRKRWGRYWTSQTLLTGYDAAGYLTELQNFVDAIRQNQPDKCHPSFADGLAIYDVMDEIEKKIVTASRGKK